MNSKFRVSQKSKELSLTKSARETLQEKNRNAGRKRVQKYRALKRAATTPTNSIRPFKSAVTLGKATTRAKRALHGALPSTPNRRKAVIRKLRDVFQDTSPAKEQPGSANENKPWALSAETIDSVQSFYQRDDISRQAPGRKDVVTVRDGDGRKTKCQARHLTSSVAEVHALYREEFPQIKIGKSKFAKLRPQHVLLSSKLPHNVCLCRYHENFITAVNALHKVEPQVPLYTHDLPQSFLCDPPSRQ